MRMASSGARLAYNQVLNPPPSLPLPAGRPSLEIKGGVTDCKEVGVGFEVAVLKHEVQQE